jgi:hypothetical protein
LNETEAEKKLKNRLAQRQHRLKTKADKERLKTSLQVQEEMAAKILSENAALREKVAALEAQVKTLNDPGKKRGRKDDDDEKGPAKKVKAEAAESEPAAVVEQPAAARPGAFPQVSPPPVAMASQLERYRDLVCNHGRSAMDRGDEEVLAQISKECLGLARGLFSGLAQTTTSVLASCNIDQEMLWCCQPAEGLTPEEAHKKWEAVVRTELGLTNVQVKFILDQRARFLATLSAMFDERKTLLSGTAQLLFVAPDFCSPAGGSECLEDVLSSIMSLRASINSEKAARAAFADLVLEELRPSQVIKLLIISAPSFPNILSFSNIVSDFSAAAAAAAGQKKKTRTTESQNFY